MKIKFTLTHLKHLIHGGIVQITDTNGLILVPAGTSVWDTKSAITKHDIIEIVNNHLNKVESDQVIS